MSKRGVQVLRPQISPTPMAYRVPLAAALIGIAPSTLWRMVADGEIQARKIGSATVIRHGDLQAFVDSAPVWKPERNKAEEL